MDDKIVYAEIDFVSDMMRKDRKCLIISDGALFLITTKSNSKWYNDKFHTVCKEAIEEYQIELKNGKVRSRMFPKVS